MNRKKSKFVTARDFVYGGMVSLAVSPLAAFATAPSEDFDPAPLLAKVAIFIAGAGLLAAAIIAGRWGLHLWSLARPKH